MMSNAALAAICWACTCGVAAAQLVPGRVFSDPQMAGSSALDVAAIALARSDLAGAESALDSIEQPGLREWLLGRIQLERGASVAAFTRFARAAASLRAGEHEQWPDRLLRQFDLDRADAAFSADSLFALGELLSAPLGSHGEDPLWRAQHARHALATGNAAAAAELFDLAHREASDSQRRRILFGWRASAHASIDSLQGGAVFLDWAEALRWPLELREAIALFDATPHLAVALNQAGHRERGIAWYARILRRDAGLALAEAGLNSPDLRERARCFVLGAEQLYRLRRDAELERWLSRAWPDSLRDDDRAALVAYPWGVRRRSGNSLENAAAFDSIATRYALTRRGIEALWEAAWEFELAGEFENAEARFLRYAQEKRAPWRSGAAARAILLPLRRGEFELVRTRHAELVSLLSDSHDRAAADWALRRAGERLQLDAAADSSALSTAPDAWNPFDRPPPFPWHAELASQGLPIDDVVAALLKRQQQAFDRVEKEVAPGALSPAATRDLQVAADFYRHGLHLEGDYVLNSLSAIGRQDAALQFRCAQLAWSMGRAERQARIGFQLRALLGKRSPELDLALERIAHPTPFAREVLLAAQQHDLPAGLLWSIARRESFYDAGVVSLAGAYGLLQLLPSTADSMAARAGEASPSIEELRMPLLNLRLGARYVRQLLEQSGGDLYRALAAYNAGEANGERWAARRGAEDPPETVLVLISYSETRAYVYHVFRFWRLYADLYPELGRWDGLPEG